MDGYSRGADWEAGRMLQRERRKAYSGAYLLRVMRVLHNDAKLRLKNCGNSGP